MSDKTWKATERAIARLLGGERVSSHGLGVRTPDVEAPAFTIEVKHRKKLPQWLSRGMWQAVRNAARGKLPLLVLHESGRHHAGDLVVLRLGDFREWFGEIEAPRDMLKIGSLCLNPQSGRVTTPETTATLTAHQSMLLAFLMQHPGVAFSEKELLIRVWGYPVAPSDGSLVRAHVRNIRKKIEPDPENPCYLLTRPRQGYYVNSRLTH